MRRVSSATDVFRPQGQTAKELDLAQSSPDEVIEVLTPRVTEQRLARLEEVLSHRTRTLTVAVEGVHDPHNTAAVIRSADAYGLQTVHVIEGATSFLSSRKVTQGAHKWVDLGVWSGPDQFAREIKNQGKQILIAAADGQKTIDELDPRKPTALVFGNEHDGISDKMRELSDGSFRIPMFGFVDSFNISVSAALSISKLRNEGFGDIPEDELKILKARFMIRSVRAGYDIVMLERERRQAKTDNR